MLRHARARGVYDVLHRAELVYYLDTQPRAFDVIVCADTRCYFGKLDKVFAAARRSLRPGGWCIFTVEVLGDDDTHPHALGASGRYAHRASYIGEALAAAGFSLQVLRNETLRMESGLPVEGCVVVARSGAEDL
jgi:predicted TPR repeat methyltransferase